MLAHLKIPLRITLNCHYIPDAQTDLFLLHPCSSTIHGIRTCSTGRCLYAKYLSLTRKGFRLLDKSAASLHWPSASQIYQCIRSQIIFQTFHTTSHITVTETNARVLHSLDSHNFKPESGFCCPGLMCWIWKLKQVNGKILAACIK